MRKAKYILFSFLLLISLSNVNAITSSGQIPSSEKEFIWYKNQKCEAGTAVKYGPLGGYYSAYANSTEKKYTYYTSTNIYTDEEYAKRACENFTKEDKNKDYLCTGTHQTSGYVCYKEGQVTFEIDKRTYENINVDGGRMYNTEEDCTKNCSGTCKVQKAYSFEYADELVEGSNSSGNINPIMGRIYSNASGDPAFCIQPTLDISCYTDNSSQYCLNNEFDLTTCNTAEGYKSDYRCGLANIVLKATKLKNNDNALTDEEYAIADVAMRMWAAYKGNLRGTEFDSLPTTQGLTNSGMNEARYMEKFLFSLTAKRTVQNSNYLNSGLTCGTDTRNIGIMCHCTSGNCDYTQKTYIESLKLFKMALDTNALDSNGMKVPELITTEIDKTTTEINITKPCDPGEDGCKINITLIDQDGNVVAEDDNVTCTKNICTAHIEGEKNSVCTETNEKYKVEVKISDIKFYGTIKEYHHCTYPTDRQIMFVFDAQADEVIDTFTKSYEVKTSCDNTCTDTKLQTTVTSVNKDGSTNKSITACDGNKDFGEGDYDGYDKITISEPGLQEILDSCDKESFRETKYEANGGGYCQVYCRKETVLYLADKTKVFSGMQFTYKLEEKIPNSQKTDEHISSIVQIKKECVSLIDYDKWENDLEELLKQVADAWTEYKKWEALRYAEVVADVYIPQGYPQVAVYDPACSTNCDIADYETGSAACSKYPYPGSYSPSGSTKTTYNAVCSNRTSTDINTAGVCNPGCHYKINWYSNTHTKYSAFKYLGNGKGTNTEATSSATDGQLGSSTRSCDASVSNGYNYTIGSCTSSCTNRPGAGSIGSFSGKIGVGSDLTKSQCNTNYLNFGYWADPDLTCSWTTTVQVPVQDCVTDAKGNKHCETYLRTDIQTNYGRCNLGSKQPNSDSCTYTSIGNCVAGKDGDPQYVAKNLIDAAQKYYSLQNQVLQMIKQIENCNLYGNDWIAGEPQFQSYSLSLTKGGKPGLLTGAEIVTGVNNHLGGSYGVGGGDGGGISTGVDMIGEDKFQSYDFSKEIDYSYAYETGNNKYAQVNLATTATNSDIIKKNILSDAACLRDNSCPDLIVDYADKVYGSSVKYDKVVNVVADFDDIYNKYCIDGNCDLTEDAVKKPTYVIECDDAASTSLNITPKKCQVKTIQLSHATRAYFTTTTEIMYYRPTTYYAENQTGKVIELKTNTRVDPGKYASLGKNVYPISNVETGIYDINYEFTNIGSGKYYNISANNQTGLKLNNFDYSCAYEAYNTTTQYDCEGNDCFASLDSSEKTCVYIDNTSADLSTTHTWTLDNITTNGEKNKKTYGFMFKNINLSDPFPNDRMGNNWKTSMDTIEEIKSSSEDIYTNKDRLELSVTLTTDAIKKIREYNSSREINAGGYQDDSLRDCEIIDSVDGKTKRFANCRSAFIDEIETGSGVLGIKANEIKRGGK